MTGVAVAAAAVERSTSSASVSGPVYSPAVTAVGGQCNETLSTRSSAQQSSVAHIQEGVIISNSSTYMVILSQLCADMGLDPPTVDHLSKVSDTYTATVSVKYGFSSSKSHSNKGDAREDAAHFALLALGRGGAENAANYRAQLNEHCQQQRWENPEYKPSNSAPFSCTVFVKILQESLAKPTEGEARDDAARGILTRLRHAAHILQMLDNPRFESFSVIYKQPSVYKLTARYQFTRLAEGDKSKKNAEKMAAQSALLQIYPDLNPKPELDQCKNKLQELYPQEKPKYTPELGDDGLYYSGVNVSFVEHCTYDNNQLSLDASDDIARRALKRLGLI